MTNYTLDAFVKAICFAQGDDNFNHITFTLPSIYKEEFIDMLDHYGYNHEVLEEHDDEFDIDVLFE